MTPQTLPSVLPESNILQLHTIDTLNRKYKNLTGITQVISQNTAHKRKEMKTGSVWTWMRSCIVYTLPLEELKSSGQVTGWDGRTIQMWWQKEKIPFLSEIKLVLSTPTASNPDNHGM